MSDGAASGHYDVIVVGIGGMGSAACRHLARRGLRVLGLERYDIPHSMGSSHGVSRIIRLAYFEDPSYVPLLRRAYALWRDLEREAGEPLLIVTGSIDAGPATGRIVAGSIASCRQHDLPHEVLDPAETARRFPAWRLADDMLAVLQPDGGFLLSERCIVAHVNSALAAGATVHAREPVTSWSADGERVRVQTDRGVYTANKLVLSPGAWAGQLVPALAKLAIPERQVLAWLQPAHPARFAPERFPVFNLEAPQGQYYGFPIWSIPGFKIGRYHHLQEVIDPDAMEREPNAVDEAALRDGVARYFPDANGPVMTARACIFTNTPDEHFIIDTLPDAPNVIVASPCSGHGFKFAAVVGEIIADLVAEGGTRHDIGLFRLERFGASQGGERSGSRAEAAALEA